MLDRVANRLVPLTTRLAARSVCVSDWMRRHVVDDLGAAAGSAVANRQSRAFGRSASRKEWGRARRARARDPGARPPRSREGLLPPDLGLRTPLGPMRGSSSSGRGPSAQGSRARRVRSVWRSEWSFRATRMSRGAISRGRGSVPSRRARSPSRTWWSRLLTMACLSCRRIAEGRVRSSRARRRASSFRSATRLPSRWRSKRLSRRPGDPAPRIARAQAFSVDRALDAYERLFDEVIAAAPG